MHLISRVRRGSPTIFVPCDLWASAFFVVVDSAGFFPFSSAANKRNLADAFSVSLLISVQCHRDLSESMHVSGGIIFFGALPLRGKRMGI